MTGEHAAGAPRMPGQGLMLQPRGSQTWQAASPWLGGARWAIAGLIALVVAASAQGTWLMIALLAFAACTFVVFRYIAAGGRPDRLIPHFAPATTGSAFALGGLFGVIALGAVVVAAGLPGGLGQSVALAIAVVLAVAIFVLIGQAWDRRSGTH
ncbi:MAG: hypothetical protein R3F55_11060 [Alphaproteobacteria bacterium]